MSLSPSDTATFLESAVPLALEALDGHLGIPFRLKLGFNHDVYWNRYIAEMWDRGAGALHVYSDFRITSLDMQTASPPINVPFGYGRWLRGLGNYVAYLSANGTELHIISSVASGPGRTPSNA